MSESFWFHIQNPALYRLLSCVQVYWNSLSRTYWVHWHMVEILDSGSSSQSEKDSQEKASSLAETLKLTAGTPSSSSAPPLPLLMVTLSVLFFS